MISIAEFLAPVREGAPCGDDPWASAVLSELETIVQGKPETQFSKAEEPDWAALKVRVIAVARTTKDLRVASILAATLLRTDGLNGFASAIEIIRGYLEKFWPDVFPLLDAAENNDASERINALANLAAPPGTDGDWLKIIPGLRRTPLLLAPQTGRYTLEHYFVARQLATWPEGAGPAPTMPLLDAAKQEVGAAGVAVVVGVVRGISSNLKAIELIFKEKAGPALFPSFEPLQREFKQIITWLGDGSVDLTIDSPSDRKPSVIANGSIQSSFAGAVQNRDDVLRALKAVIAYYRNCEPSSPVPFLLSRAVRIVPMDFVEMMNELTPEAREKINMVIGTVESTTAKS
ncbi:MAG: type VI secretion system ImpA family N-terminal domain-containing protein [Opitutus sp.]